MGVAGFGISGLGTSVEKTLKDGRKKDKRKRSQCWSLLALGNRREIVGGLGVKGSERVSERRIGRARQWGGNRWGKKADLDPFQRDYQEMHGYQIRI